MNGVIGDILPLALGVAISPIPIIAAILMLLSPKAKGTSVGFLLGWVLGIIVAIVIFELLASIIPASDPDASAPIAGVIKLVLGLGLLFLALRQWKGRPKNGEEAALPKWMAAIDTMTATRALILGFILSAVNPKNLLMAVGAGVTVGTAGLSIGSVVVVTLIFVIIAAITVAGPVIAFLVAGDKLASPLERLRAFLVGNNAAIMAVLLLVIGIVMLGKGIGSF